MRLYKSDKSYKLGILRSVFGSKTRTEKNNL